jgi:hypothetical protein
MASKQSQHFNLSLKITPYLNPTFNYSKDITLLNQNLQFIILKKLLAYRTLLTTIKESISLSSK